MLNLEHDFTGNDFSADVALHRYNINQDDVDRFFVNHRLQDTVIGDECMLHSVSKTPMEDIEIELLDASGKKSERTNKKGKKRNNPDHQKICKLASSSKKISKAESKDHNDKEKRSRQTWTSQEDQSILDLIGKYGLRWSFLSQKMAGVRTGKQIRDRYLNKLHPDVKATRWEQSEDEQLFRLFKLHGRKWREISKLMPGRSETMVKNRVVSMLKDSCLLEEGQKKNFFDIGAQSTNGAQRTHEAQSTNRTQSTAPSSGTSTSIGRFFQDNDLDLINRSSNLVEEPLLNTPSSQVLGYSSENPSDGTFATHFGSQRQLCPYSEERKRFLIYQIAQAKQIMTESIKELESLL